jgi:hypothetical protein
MARKAQIKRRALKGLNPAHGEPLATLTAGSHPCSKRAIADSINVAWIWTSINTNAVNDYEN